MFWGLKIKSNPKNSDPVEHYFFDNVKLSHVALEPIFAQKGTPVKTATPTGNKNKKFKQDQSVKQNGVAVTDDNQKQSPVTLYVEYENKKFVLCTLDPNLSWQCPLDLLFQEGSSVKFTLRGQGTVHLSGYKVPDELDSDDEDSDPIYNCDTSDDSDVVEVEQKERTKAEIERDISQRIKDLKNKDMRNIIGKSKNKRPTGKDKAEDEADDGEEEDDDDDYEEEDDEDIHIDTTVDSDEEEDDDDDEDDDEEDDDEDDNDEDDNDDDLDIDDDDDSDV